MSILSKRVFAFALALVMGMLLPACSVNVKKNNDGEDKNVDIKTPIGGIHVSNDADVRDTGLPVYPGARLKSKDEDGDQKSANVDISGFGFGMKVVAIEYTSGDPPAKLIAFYQEQLKKYGNVLQCHMSGHFNYNRRGDEKGSNELKCEGDNSGKNVELKAGTEDNQHIVSVESNGSGSSFALVYVRTHGKEDSI
ncbi:MAG: hypothetical protein ACRD2U_16060 [Terriglobales bacterium]